MRKKLLIIFLAVLPLIFSVACGMSGAGAEKDMLKWGTFCAVDKFNETTLTMNADKTYTLYIHSYEKDKMQTYEGTWSYVLTYKFKYTVEQDPAGLIKTTHSDTWYVFKLDGYTDRGEQGYFVYREYFGTVHTADGEMNKDYFEKYKASNGLVRIPGTDMKGASDK